MSPANIIRIFLLGCCLGLVGSGCDPGRTDQVDEEKEPQFLIGRNLVNAMNYSAAIKAFKRALEMNPRSAAANLELGWLYAEKQVDEAAAIHYYQEYLRLRPHADNGEMIRQHILRLRQELARTVMPIPPSAALQNQLEQLAAENRRLQGEVDQLRQALAQARQSSASANPAREVGAALSTPLRPPTPAPQPASTRSHRVRAGETFTSIAQQYNIPVETLMRANSGLDPRRIQVGQTIALPQR
ncbi:MAG TPA: LysM peptidoglycan-binding domain-containing protein [Verrucomicrobiota bacterium]|nr:LysM peptidoglycan-binding domain-containing protein [Verrucomicrobiota bacterium]HNT13734.1 LysM peptidoglycan-binding domain-containing protein [Verrucomicrobiota bacterium]